MVSIPLCFPSFFGSELLWLLWLRKVIVSCRSFHCFNRDKSICQHPEPEQAKRFQKIYVELQRHVIENNSLESMDFILILVKKSVFHQLCVSSKTRQLERKISKLDSSDQKTDFQQSNVHCSCFLAQASLIFLLAPFSSRFFAAIRPWRPDLHWTVDVEMCLFLELCEAFILGCNFWGW